MDMRVKVLGFAMIFMIAQLIIIVGESVKASDELQLNLTKKQPIDIVLTVGETADDLSNFESDIKSKLSARGVDTSLVNVEAIETATMSSNDEDAEKVFNDWINYPNDRGRWNFDSSIRSVGSTANTYWSGFWNPSDASDIELSFDMRVYPPNDNDNIGFTFNMDKKNGKYSFYAFVLDRGGAMQSGLYKIEDWNPDRENAPNNWSGREGLLVPVNQYYENYWRNVEIKSNDGHIVINYDGRKLIEYEDNDPLEGGGYGPFTHSQRYGYFKNISIKEKNSKDFTEVIRQPEWREGSDRYIVNVSAEEMDEFNNESKVSEMLTRTLNEGVHFLAADVERNEHQMRDFIKKNDGNGKIFKVNYNRYMDYIADYIEERIPDEQGKGELYVLKDEPIDIDVTPSSLRNNTSTSYYPEGRWRIEHDYDYYDNNEGQAQWANQWQEDLKLTFDKPGKYELFFEEENIEPRYIYVHRKPIVQFDVQRTGNVIDVTDTSYDLDHQNDSDRGIKKVEWKWQKVEDGIWYEGKPSGNLEMNKDYIVQLRVKDKEGVWSDRESKYITTKPVESTPVASFSFKENPVSKYDRLTIDDTSYDPAGKSIITDHWVVQRDDGAFFHDSSQEPRDIEDWDAGKYKVTLKVKNTDNNWSEPYSRNLIVTDDNKKPEVLIVPASRSWDVEGIDFNLTFSDPGGSGLEGQRYQLNKSSTFPNSGWGNWNSSSKESFNFNNSGEYYLHMQARDGAGNMMKRTTGPYRIDKDVPDKPTIHLSSYDWVDSVSYTISDNGDKGSGVDKIQYKLEGDSSWRDYEYITKNIPSNLKGEVDIKARVKDNVGNISDVSHEIAKIDDKTPVIDGMDVSVNNNKARIIINAKDMESGIGGYKYYMDEDGSGFTPVTDWISNDEFVRELEESKRYRFKVEVKDKNSNTVRSDKYSSFYFVTTPKVTYSGTKDGDFKNTATIEWTPYVGESSNGVNTEIYREGKLWRTFNSGGSFKDENLDYERSYEYKIRNVYEDEGNKFYSEWLSEEIDIGTPELEFDTSDEVYYRTPFSREVVVDGVVRFRQGADVEISVLGDSKEFEVMPYETVDWSIPVDVEKEVENVKVKVETLDGSLDQGVEKLIDIKVMELNKDNGYGLRFVE